MSYNLVELRAFGEKAHGFCLPVFSSANSNDAYAQNLDCFGNVVEFLPVNLAEFPRIDLIAPPFSTNVGLAGLLAFVGEDSSPLVLTQSDMKEALKGLDISDPFIALEVAALLDNRPLQRKAVRECASILGPDRSIARWATRERKLFRASEVHQEDISAQEPTPEDRFSKEFNSLERHFEASDWPAKWIMLWTQGYRKRELVGLAALRLDRKFSFGVDGTKIFQLIFDFDDSDFVIQHALNALAFSRVTEDAWRLLFNRVYRHSYQYRTRLLEIARSRLGQDVAEVSSPSRQWVSVWSAAFSNGEHRREGWMLAREYVDRIPSLSEESARILVFPFRRFDSEFEPFLSKTCDWVKLFPRSTVVWSALFLKILEFDKSPEILDVGLSFLYQLGGNLTSWVNVWSAYHGLIEEGLRRSLALGWLRRARWDLRSWVDLYLLLLDGASPSERGELKAIGSSWLKSGYGSKTNHRRVRQAVSYLDSLPGS